MSLIRTNSIPHSNPIERLYVFCSQYGIKQQPTNKTRIFCHGAKRFWLALYMSCLLFLNPFMQSSVALPSFAQTVVPCLDNASPQSIFHAFQSRALESAEDNLRLKSKRAESAA